MGTYDELLDPTALGAMRMPDFIDEAILSAASDELADPERVVWQNSHDVYVNQRGLTIIQNHDTYALKLSRGDQSPRERIPTIMDITRAVIGQIAVMSHVIPSLAEWTPDELSIHRYDDPDIGLSGHKDNLRFTHLIAIVSLENVCDLTIIRDGIAHPITAHAGDLMLLRAPGLIDSDVDLRPEHAVVNLRSSTRTSLMLRANNRPDDHIAGFRFANW
jgi:hypothetical protein